LNLSSATWAEPRAVQSISRILETYRAQAARLVIEMPQRVHRALDPTRLGLVGAMAARGVRFAMDQVSDLRLDPAALADRGFRFVKAPAALLEALAERPSGLDIDAADVAQLMRRAGIELIGERAETDRQIADLMELDVRLAQGFAISEPRPVRPEAFQPGQAGVAASVEETAEALVEQAPRPAAESQPERVPFRAVLRRASA
jgi:cyclic-di-GMP phosphodiesterase TipF (flagellum assembly factor)